MDFIPVENHSFYYYQFMLVFVILVFIQSFQYEIDESGNLSSKKILGSILFLFALVYIGFRPISSMFGDMIIYSRSFDSYKLGASPTFERDLLFEYFLYYSSKIMSGNLFFFLCTSVYIVPLFLACKKIFVDYWFYGFFMLVISFSFWGYGVNGIRNGMATSVFLFGISHAKKHHIYLLFFIAISIHKSLILPTFAFVICSFYTDSKKYFYLWLLAIPISLVAGSFFSTILLSSGLVEEDRLAGYFDEFDIDASGGSEMKIGFRWDFILYSATGVLTGYYFIIKRKFKDVFYSKLYNTYLVSNAIWILIIRANFSNRFAYLSWFMLGLIVIYPFLKLKFFHNQHLVIGKVIVAYFFLSYFFNVILA